LNLGIGLWFLALLFMDSDGIHFKLEFAQFFVGYSTCSTAWQLPIQRFVGLDWVSTVHCTLALDVKLLSLQLRAKWPGNVGFGHSSCLLFSQFQVAFRRCMCVHTGECYPRVCDCLFTQLVAFVAEWRIELHSETPKQMLLNCDLI